MSKFNDKSFQICLACKLLSYRQSSTEDEEPLVPIDPSDLIHLFPDADNAQYHDGLTDSDGKFFQCSFNFICIRLNYSGKENLFL